MGPTPRLSDSFYLEWELRICISDKFQHHVDVTGWRLPFENHRSGSSTLLVSELSLSLPRALTGTLNKWLLESAWGNQGPGGQNGILTSDISLFESGPKGTTKEGGSGQRDLSLQMGKVPNCSLQLIRICVGLLENHSKDSLDIFYLLFLTAVEKVVNEITFTNVLIYSAPRILYSVIWQN